MTDEELLVQFEKINGQFAIIDQRFDGLDSQVKELDRNNAAMEKEIKEIRGTQLSQYLEQQKQERDFAVLERNVSRMQEQMSGMEERQESMENFLQSIRADMLRHNEIVEPALKKIMEGLDGFRERSPQIDMHEKKLENHDIRICALEHAVKVG
ncbi:MAG: hypothetical protein FWF49_01785 [Oscillospiraceae bacterium]|nr:hypothetical protein [Oscillospiraceae bacterium]